MLLLRPKSADRRHLMEIIRESYGELNYNGLYDGRMMKDQMDR
jgi:hypothetical protein